MDFFMFHFVVVREKEASDFILNSVNFTAI